MGYLDWPPELYDSRQEYSLGVRIYDLFYGERNEGLPFYVGYAKRFGSPILELGCGTGRILQEIAQVGYNIMGLDSCEEMLAAGKWKQNENLKKHIQISLGDIRDFNFEQKFNLIFGAFGTFSHLLTDEDRLKAFWCIRKHLNSDGVFVMDEQIDPMKLSSEKIRIKQGPIDPKTSLPVRMISNYIQDISRKCVCRYDFYDWLDGESVAKRLVLRVTYRRSNPKETIALMNEAGFRQVEVLGNFQGAKFNFDEVEKNDRQILVAYL